jgi:hypothetical protein
MKSVHFMHTLVDEIPEELQAGILYVSRDGDVAGHLCACGCGKEVITPLSPTDWSLTLTRQGATLNPSIGNWAFPCRSHYFISSGNVIWAKDMANKTIAKGRQLSRMQKQSYYDKLNNPPSAIKDVEHKAQPPKQQQGYLQRLATWWKNFLSR